MSLTLAVFGFLLALAAAIDARRRQRRNDAVEKIEKVWLRGPIRYDLGRWLFRRFGVNQLSMLPDQALNRIAAAIR